MIFIHTPYYTPSHIIHHRNFRKYKDNKLIIKPAKKSVKKVIDKIRKRIKENSNQKQETLIKKLNQVIIGWSNYHQVVCAKETFKKRKSI